MTPRAGVQKKFRLALVGAGRFAHLYHVPALVSDPRAELVMICDPTPSSVTTRLARSTGAALAADITAAIDGDACDAVVISTPHALHAGQVRAALAARKHVLVDKPFVLRSAEARDLAGTAAARGLIGRVAFQRRLDPAYRSARRIIEDGRLGRLRMVESTQLGGEWVIVADGNLPRDTGPSRPAWYVDPAVAGGGVLFGRGAHVADVVPWLVGRAPIRVRSWVVPSPAGPLDLGGVVDVDFGGLLWRAATLADRAPLTDEVRLIGERGRVEIRKPEGTLRSFTVVHEDPEYERLSVIRSRRRAIPAVVDFLDALEGRPSLGCTLEDAVISVRILEAAYASSAADGCWVDF